MPSNALSPLSNVMSTSDRVTSAIREAILSGRLKPAETLIERQLATSLGVSKTPVREALISLTTSGLVVSTPNRGVSVRALTLDDVRQIYEFRMLVEPWAAAQTTRMARGASLDGVERALADARALRGGPADGADKAAWRRSLTLANRRFHRELYVGCGNALVIDRLDQLQDLTALSIVSILWKQWPTWEVESAEHEHIFEMMSKGRDDTVEDLVRDHIAHSISRLSSIKTAGG